ncbi:MAG: hypothetical protein K2X93_21775 [Candidatus Obscuribacterales bacterium]|nr:hypothetical protein [Candidatus Obscuribacterales bacterium]
MSGTFRLQIITPERQVLDTEVTQVTATARDGELSILPDHEPLVTALGVDVLTYWEKGEPHTAAVIAGILEVSSNRSIKPHGKASEGAPLTSPGVVVTVLSDAAELATEIDEARAKQAKDRAEAEKTQRVDKLDTQLAEMALAKAITRMKAVQIARERKRLH